jgi:Flp pilus assembly secretin CpaC
MTSFAPQTSAARQLVLWLFTAAAMLAMAASLPGKARAAAEDLIVNYDQSQLLKLPRPAAEIIIGNPSIADVTVQGGNLLVVTGKTFGITNMIILDAQRNVILEQRILVKRDETKVVNLNRGTLRRSYNCTPQCNPSIVIGDDDAFFDSVSKASEKKIGFSERSTDQAGQQSGQ